MRAKALELLLKEFLDKDVIAHTGLCSALNVIHNSGKINKDDYMWITKLLNIELSNAEIRYTTKLESRIIDDAGGFFFNPSYVSEENKSGAWIWPLYAIKPRANWIKKQLNILRNDYDKQIN